jgi:hypothetical protein
MMSMRVLVWMDQHTYTIANEHGTALSHAICTSLPCRASACCLSLYTCSILWAGVSMVDLTYELVTARNKNPLTFPFALLHVTFTLLSQLVGVTSRFVIAMLALVPVERHGTLSGECGVWDECAESVMHA